MSANGLLTSARRASRVQKQVLTKFLRNPTPWQPGRLARNTVLATLWQGVRLVLQVLYLVMLAHILGVDGYGVFAGVVALAMSLSPFAGLGFSLVLVQQISRRPDAFSVYWGRMLTAIAVSALPLVAATIAAVTLLLPSAEPPMVVWLVAVAELALAPIISASANVYQAHERLSAYMVNFVGLNLARLAAIVMLWLWVDTPDLSGLALAYFAGTAASAIWSAVAVTRSFGWPKFDLRGAHHELRKSLSFSLTCVASAAHNEFDKTLLLRLGNAQAAGAYAVASRVISAATLPLNAYVLATVPRLFIAGEAGVAAGVRATARLMLPVVVYGLVAGAGIIVLADWLPLLLGEDFGESVVIAQFLSPLPLLIGISSMYLGVLSCSGAQHTRTRLEVAALALNLTLNLVLIPLFGVFGAVIAILASQSTLAALTGTALYRLTRGDPLR